MSLEGFLKKQGVKGPRKTFKKRWFVLKDDNKIYYYERKNEATEKGFIDVAEAISVTADQSKKGTFAFQINTPRRIYYLQAESQENADYWINGVNDILKTLGTNSDVARLSALLEQANNRVGDLEAQLAKLRSALDFAASELGTDRDAIVRRVDQGEKPKAPRAEASSAATSTSSSAPSAASATADAPPSSSAAAAAAAASAGDAPGSADGAPADDKQLKTTFGAQVLYDYNARKDYELTIHVNEIITVLSQHENGWWLGCNHAGKQGYFPGSYVRALT